MLQIPPPNCRQSCYRRSPSTGLCVTQQPTVTSSQISQTSVSKIQKGLLGLVFYNFAIVRISKWRKRKIAVCFSLEVPVGFTWLYQFKDDFILMIGIWSNLNQTYINWLYFSPVTPWLYWTTISKSDFCFDIICWLQEITIPSLLFVFLQSKNQFF